MKWPQVGEYYLITYCHKTSVISEPMTTYWVIKIVDNIFTDDVIAGIIITTTVHYTQRGNIERFHPYMDDWKQLTPEEAVEYALEG